MHPAAALTIAGCLAWIAGAVVRDLFGGVVLGCVAAFSAGVLIAVLWGVSRKC